MTEPTTLDDERAGITITRVFDAPRERVWQEWTEPERFADWFGGAEAEVPLSTVSMDVRPGGAWRMTMFSGPERFEIHWTGEYREVVAPERLVFTVSDQPDDDVYELDHRRPHRPRRRPHRDALRAARAHAARASTSAPSRAGRSSSTAWTSGWPRSLTRG